MGRNISLPRQIAVFDRTLARALRAPSSASTSLSPKRPQEPSISGTPIQPCNLPSDDHYTCRCPAPETKWVLVTGQFEFAQPQLDSLARWHTATRDHRTLLAHVIQDKACSGFSGHW